MTSTPTQQLSDAGVSIWLDDLSRNRLETGTLQKLIDEKNVVGVTTNPSIFHAAITTATGTVSRVVRDVRLHRGRNQLSLRVPANWRPHRAILRLRPYVPPTADAPDGPTWGRAVSLDLTFKT